MSDEAEEEGILPSGALDLAAQGGRVGMGVQQVERPPAQQRQGLAAIPLARAGAVLVEHHIQHPVQLVLNRPVLAHHPHQRLPRHQLG
jgi:hypothetical protein